MFLRNVGNYRRLTLASTDESARRQNPEEQHQPHRRENLKLHIYLVTTARRVLMLWMDDTEDDREYTKRRSQTIHKLRSSSLGFDVGLTTQ
jgi:hypothetical protein